MICGGCQRSGYNFQKVEGKNWCGTCAMSGPRTIGIGAGAPAYSGRMGAGTITGLPPLVPLNEWQEIIRLCKKVSGYNLTEAGKASNLMEGPVATLPTPKMKNPLTETPQDRRDQGWTPLEEYFKTLNDPPAPPTRRSNPFGNLFEG